MPACHSRAQPGLMPCRLRLTRFPAAGPRAAGPLCQGHPEWPAAVWRDGPGALPLAGGAGGCSVSMPVRRGGQHAALPCSKKAEQPGVVALCPPGLTPLVLAASRSPGLRSTARRCNGCAPFLSSQPCGETLHTLPHPAGCRTLRTTPPACWGTLPPGPRQRARCRRRLTALTGRATGRWGFPWRTWSSTRCTCAASRGTPPAACRRRVSSAAAVLGAPGAALHALRERCSQACRPSACVPSRCRRAPKQPTCCPVRRPIIV